MSFDFQIINGDLLINKDGTLATLTDTPKLSQDIIKIIITPLGSNIFNPWYGSDVNEQIIGMNLPDNLTVQQIQMSVQQALANLQQLQVGQASSQLVTLGEQINSVQNVSVQRDANDPRILNVFVSVITKQLGQVQEMFSISQ